MSNDRFKYAIHNKGVEGRKREWDYIDWVLVLGLAGWIIIMTLGVIGSFNHQ